MFLKVFPCTCCLLLKLYVIPNTCDTVTDINTNTKMLPIFRDIFVHEQRRLQNLTVIRKRMTIRTENNPFNLPDARFIELFRLNKRLVRELINILEPRIVDRQTQKGLTIETKIFCTLRFFATGSYQRCVGQDYNNGLSQTSVHRCITSITRALADLAEDFIQMPTTINERNMLKFEFMNRWGFPGTIGAIDGFHVAILKPRIDEHNYINRKGYHSLNIQIVCDHTLKIRSLFANFGGSTHDSFIWRASDVQRFMQELFYNNEVSWLVGDSGYPLQPYLLTPFRNPEEASHVRYNRAHCSARNCIERTIGLLKMRFRCLLKERSSRYAPEFMCKVVKCCAILHNMCINENIPFEEILGNEDDDELLIPNNPNYPQAVEGLQARNNIVNRYFV